MAPSSSLAAKHSLSWIRWGPYAERIAARKKCCDTQTLANGKSPWLTSYRLLLTQVCSRGANRRWPPPTRKPATICRATSSVERNGASGAYRRCCPAGEDRKLVAEGDVDFVARGGDFAGLAASLVERRLRWAERSETPLGAPWTGFPGETAEIFRHEINNPLTGILGNAELVLSHRSHLPPADVQRLQTVVDLAVRLRETTRRLSNALEAGRIR